MQSFNRIHSNIMKFNTFTVVTGSEGKLHYSIQIQRNGSKNIKMRVYICQRKLNQSPVRYYNFRKHIMCIMCIPTQLRPTIMQNVISIGANTSGLPVIVSV